MGNHVGEHVAEEVEARCLQQGAWSAKIRAGDRAPRRPRRRWGPRSEDRVPSGSPSIPTKRTSEADASQAGGGPGSWLRPTKPIRIACRTSRGAGEAGCPPGTGALPSHIRATRQPDRVMDSCHGNLLGRFSARRRAFLSERLNLIVARALSVTRRQKEDLSLLFLLGLPTGPSSDQPWTPPFGVRLPRDLSARYRTRPPDARHQRSAPVVRRPVRRLDLGARACPRMPA